ncbi:hypothetical protein SERLA73DRAFT_78566 [Serpula lacrymans var. lacrymans S7.3]|uniref:Uncharacterized protein n=2 Tax=Serpula lacrymans var. lacrymans TaxID=341189 RepID=F8QDN5_SERL3|nr:uncharacterized protein SERLADRAFT_411960 [Serpula lacrymans var. lacrymans S7.9]EGN93706.1 hypothetical protein SERLA73DRAFT_78566 [Serpula lacrymans var. lacrymans S7.3]EGO19076.1 hypothetical protein SERLADRAFT_411960 [Serpula lacrymans var. lacrymans S7.9]
MFMIHTFLFSTALCLNSSTPWSAIIHTVIIWIFAAGYEPMILDISPSVGGTSDIYLPGYWTFPDSDLRIATTAITGLFINLSSIWKSIRSTNVCHCTEIYRWSCFDANNSKSNVVDNLLQPRSDNTSKTIDTLYVELVNTKASHLLDRLDMPATIRLVMDSKYERQFKQKKRRLRDRADAIQAMENDWETHSTLLSKAKKNSTWVHFVAQVVIYSEEVTSIGLWLAEVEEVIRKDQVAVEVQQLVQGFQRGTDKMMEAESRCATSNDKAARRKRAMEFALDPTRGLKTMQDIIDAVKEAEAAEGDDEQSFLRTSVTLAQAVDVAPNHRTSPKESAVLEARSAAKAPVLSDITNSAKAVRPHIPIYCSHQPSSGMLSRFTEGVGRAEAGRKILGSTSVSHHFVKASNGRIMVAENNASYSSSETLRTDSSP